VANAEIGTKTIMSAKMNGLSVVRGALGIVSSFEARATEKILTIRPRICRPICLRTA